MPRRKNLSPLPVSREKRHLQTPPTWRLRIDPDYAFYIESRCEACDTIRKRVCGRCYAVIFDAAIERSQYGVSPDLIWPEQGE